MERQSEKSERENEGREGKRRQRGRERDRRAEASLDNHLIPATCTSINRFMYYSLNYA